MVTVIKSELRGMCNWSTDGLLNAVIGPQHKDTDDKNALKVYSEKGAGVRNLSE